MKRPLKDQANIEELLVMQGLQGNKLTAKEIRGLGYTSFRKGKFAQRGILKKIKETIKSEKELQKRLNREFKKAVAEREKREIQEKKDQLAKAARSLKEDLQRSLMKKHAKKQNKRTRKSNKRSRKSKTKKIGGPKRVKKFYSLGEGETKKCPFKGCRKIAKTTEEVKEMFGVRNMDGIQRAQSLCKKHRHAKRKK